MNRWAIIPTESLLSRVQGHWPCNKKLPILEKEELSKGTSPEALAFEQNLAEIKQTNNFKSYKLTNQQIIFQLACRNNQRKSKKENSVTSGSSTSSAILTSEIQVIVDRLKLDMVQNSTKKN